MSCNSMEDFQRDISYRVSRQNEGRILLTAGMRDVFHDIVMEVLVQESDLRILVARVDFHKCPETLCQSVSGKLEVLVGVIIGKGLTRTIQEVTGGPQGCINLRNLLSGLLPLAINVKAAAGFSDERVMLDSIRDNLAGACAGYPEKNPHKENDDKSYLC